MWLYLAAPQNEFLNLLVPWWTWAPLSASRSRSGRDFERSCRWKWGDRGSSLTSSDSRKSQSTIIPGIKFLYHRLARPIAEKYKLVVLIFVRQFAVYLWLNLNFIDWTFSSHKQKQWLARLKIQTCVFKVMTNSSKSFSAEGFGERLNTEDILLLNRKTSSN